MDTFVEFVMNNLPSFGFGAIIAFLVTSYFNRRTLLDSLDTKSGWRDKLFDAASSNEISLEQVYVIRTSLRYKTKENLNKPFDKMTKVIILFCDSMRRKYDNTQYLNDKDSEKLRIYARYLLKHHWEENHLLMPKIANCSWKKKEATLYEKTRKMIINLK